MEMNFIGIELDATHLFFSRILGLLGVFYSGLLVQLPEEVADAVFPYQTLFLVAFYAMGPVFAFLTMPIKSPDFLQHVFCGILVVAQAILIAAFKRRQSHGELRRPQGLRYGATVVELERELADA